MSGRAILNIETAFALAMLLALLWRAGAGPLAPSRFANWGDAARMSAVAVLTIVVFWRAAHIYFLSDDFVLVNMAREFQASPGAGKYWAMFTRGGGDGFFRPLGYLSLFWTWPWAGFDPARWHAVGLALHVANALLVYMLASSVGFSKNFAWFASALFALDAAHPEAAVWIAGRFDVLSTLFVLISLIAFVHLWEKPSVAAALVSVLAMVLGILSKESAYAAPLMMLVYAASRPGSFSRRIRFLAPFFALAIALFAFRWMLQGGIGGYVTAQGAPQIFALNPISAAKALALRLWAILFFPMDWEKATTWLTIAAILYALAWVAIAWKPAGPRRRLWLALGLTLAAAIPPVQQLLIGPDLQKSRLLYLPSVGFCLLAAAAVEMATSRLRVAAGAVILAFSALALLHNLDIWENVAAKSQAVSQTLAACSNADSVKLPGSLDGVYFFANGAAESLQLQRAQHPDTPRHTCSLTWDDKTRELKPY